VTHVPSIIDILALSILFFQGTKLTLGRIIYAPSARHRRRFSSLDNDDDEKLTLPISAYIFLTRLDSLKFLAKL